ncbi:hypothetical protein OPS25_15795 [Alteromonas ponticola]|uniref:Uncharacterized protein n=1 Tax=Alteromonas aquimaris TaxID=2998417 RepID=A0ABT3PB56_9ALTE|nr:hypothetical protein [Alteromonas aquimaris]MCW8109969.1 hypothetical protein [Alteromonas aquimaris]
MITSAPILANSSNPAWSFGANVSKVLLDSDAASQAGVESRALQTGFHLDYIVSNWVSTAGFTFITYDDNNAFLQTVIGEGPLNRRYIIVESSDANAILLQGATGYRWMLNKSYNIDFIAQAGFSLPVISERSIGSCTRCYSEDIDLDGGAFVMGRLGHNGRSVRFGLSIQQFISGDLGTVMGLEIGSSF